MSQAEAEPKMATTRPTWRWLRRLRSLLTTTVVVAVVGLAMLAGLVNLLSPYARHFRSDIEGWLSTRLDQAVSITEVRAEWQLRGPKIIVEGMELGRDTDKLYVGTANFGIDLLHWIDPRRRGVSYFQLVGDDIELIRTDLGRWRLTGIGGDSKLASDNDSNGLSWLLKQNSISLSARSFTLRDEQSGRALQLDNLHMSSINLSDQLVLSGRAGADNSGELEFSLEVDMFDNGADWDRARVYLQGNRLLLPLWLGGARLGGVRFIDGIADVELSAWLTPSGPQRVFGQFSSDQATIENEHPLTLDDNQRIDTRYRLDHVASTFDFAQLESGWQLELTDFSWRRGAQRWPKGDMTVASDGLVTAITADFLRIQDLSDLAVVSAKTPASWRRQLYGLAPQGDVYSLRIDDFNQLKHRSDGVQARLENVGWLSTQNLPGVSGLDGAIRDLGLATGVELSSEEILLDYSSQLRWPLLLKDVTLSGQLDRSDDDWSFDAENFAFAEEGMSVSGSFLASGNSGAAPFLDLKLSVADADVRQARRYWPTGKFNPKLVQWLDGALKKGRVTDGQLLVYGRLGDWPFTANQGRFEATAKVDGFMLDYHPDWPAAEDLRVDLKFDARGMRGQVHAATVAGLEISAALADIPRFSAPVLSLGIDAEGQGPQMLSFLQDIPVDLESEIADLSIDGRGHIRVDIEHPLKRELGSTALTGTVELTDATVFDGRWQQRFDQTQGTVEFDQSGFSVSQMDTVFRGWPAKLSLAGGAAVDSSGHSIEASLVGGAEPSIFLQDAPLLGPLLKGIVGDPVWHVTAAMAKAPEQGGLLEIRSDLAGATTTLPVPQAKPAAQLMPLDLTIPLGQTQADWRLEIADIGWAQLNNNGGLLRGNVVFGKQQAKLDGSRGLAIEGTLPAVDIDGWQQWLSEQFPAPNSGVIDSSFVHAIDLKIEQARSRGRDFSNLKIKAAPLADHWRVALDGDQVRGSLRIPLKVDDRQLMLAEFDRLELPKPVLEEQTDTSRSDPARYPPLQFIAQAMKLEDLNLGQVRLEAFPAAQGMHIDLFETRSEAMQISASGDWLKQGVTPHSEVKATLTAEDLGALLKNFGVDGVVTGGQTLARIDASWDGSPLDFELTKLSGELSIDIGSGQITEVDPGAGRLIGLLSLQYLPRRLAFDFRDLFQSGLTFDSLSGQFQLADGNATTEGIRIKGPTAEINIKGRVGLAQRDYDQTVTVTPKVSGALPLIGAIAQGPAGAAAGAVLQNMLRDPLGRLTEIQYSVTGSWDDPQIEPVSRRPIADAPPSSEPSQSAEPPPPS